MYASSLRAGRMKLTDMAARLNGGPAKLKAPRTPAGVP